jgi:hypothetical protein
MTPCHTVGRLDIVPPMRRALALALALALPLAARAQSAVTEEAGPPPPKKLIIGLGAGALAAFAAGGALGGVALSMSNEQEGSPGNPAVYTQALADRARLGNNLAIGAYACFGLGGALALVDVVMLIELARHPRKSSTAALRLVPAGARF